MRDPIDTTTHGPNNATTVTVPFPPYPDPCNMPC